MTDRVVSVELRARVASYNRDVLSAAAATGVLAKQTDAADRGIDKFSGRLGLLLDTVASLGPSLVPISAVGIPAVTGLGASLGFVATGLGAVLASAYGVSDSLKALNKYALEPTDANLQKVEQTLLKLAPEAQAFVLQLRGLGPELKEIRDAGAGELFPHWSDAIDDLETLLPTIEELVTRVARKVGEISEQGAESLASPRWTEFFSFLQDETPLAIGKLAHSVGSLGHATAELWMAFDPLNDDFLNVLVRGSDQIDEWATGLSKTEGFKEFVDYIETNGPQVGDTIGAIAMALLDIVEAAAPIGAATLPILEAVADVIGVIADSDLGTPILGLLAMSRGLTMLERARPTGLISDFKTLRNYDMNLWGAATVGGLKAATKETARYDAALKRIHGNLGKIAGGAVALGGLMAVQSGLTDKIGLTNTALGATAGLMVGGPWGAAIGGGIGLVMDFAKGQDDSKLSVDALTDAINKQTGVMGQQGFVDVSTNLQQYQDTLDAVGISLADATQAAIQGGPALKAVTDQIDAYITSLGPISGSNYDAAAAAGDLSGALSDSNGVVAESRKQFEAQQAAADAAAGAMDHHASSAERALNPTQEVAEAIDDLGDHALSTSEKADALKASIDALLGPGLDLSAATDAWRAGLRDLDDELSDSGRHLRGFTQDATENREVIRGRVTDLVAMLNAEAAAGAGPKKLAASLREGKKALLDQAEAAGLSREATRQLLNTLGLTPKMVKTIIEVAGDLEAKGKAKSTRTEYEKIPHKIDTDIQADNHQALAASRQVRDSLAQIQSKSITLRVNHVDNFIATHSPKPRALGGPVRAGETYLVGERRPELFVPSTDGAILPSTSSRTVLGGPTGGKGGGGSTYGSGSDAGGKPLLESIIKAMLGGGFGPGLLRHFEKSLNEIQRGLTKHHGKWTDELRKQAHDLFKEVREADKERGRSIREAFKSFEDDLTQGAATIRTELRDLKRDLREAGGVWNSSLHKHGERILHLAQRYDAQAAALESQTKTLDDLTAAGADLAGKWQSLSDTVAGNFTSDLFGNGLGGFFSTAAGDTANASMFEEVLKKLAAMGLDGPAFEALAASGDLKTAIQLLNSGMIDAFETTYANRSSALGSVGAYAGDTVYGQAIADNNAAIQQQNVLITSTQATMEHLQALVDRQQGVLRDLAGLDRRVGQSAYEGTKQGAEDGIKGVTSDAGRRQAQSNGPSWKQYWR